MNQNFNQPDPSVEDQKLSSKIAIFCLIFE